MQTIKNLRGMCPAGFESILVETEDIFCLFLFTHTIRPTIYFHIPRMYGICF